MQKGTGRRVGSKKRVAVVQRGWGGGEGGREALVHKGWGGSVGSRKGGREGRGREKVGSLGEGGVRKVWETLFKRGERGGRGSGVLQKGGMELHKEETERGERRGRRAQRRGGLFDVGGSGVQKGMGGGEGGGEEVVEWEEREGWWEGCWKGDAGVQKGWRGGGERGRGVERKGGVHKEGGGVFHKEEVEGKWVVYEGVGG